MALQVCCVKITDTQREQRGQLRMDGFYFGLCFFARAVGGQASYGLESTQSGLTHLCLGTATLKELSALLQGICSPSITS